MNNNSNGLGCVMGCWLIALAAGVLLAALLMIVGSLAFTPAAFFGLLAFVLGGAFLSWMFCKSNPVPTAATAGAAGVVATGAVASSANGSGSAAARTSSDAVVREPSAAVASGAAAPSATDAPTLTPSAAPAPTPTPTPAASVKSDTTLTGEEELAGRKGEWKYEAEAAAEKPVVKKPAAKKPAAKKAATETPVAKKAATKTPTAKKPAAKKAEVKPVAKDGKPELLKKARAGGADDLKQIKGVGPKMEGMLNTMGIFHFDQVSSWRKAEVQWVDDNLEGFKGRVSRDEWVKQAKILAKGGTTAFSKKVDKGGVY